MKKIINSLIIIIMILCLTACSSMTFSKESQYTNLSTTNEVTLSIKEGSKSDTSLILLIENNTENELSYDTTYFLEHKKGDNWYSLDKEMIFTSLAVILKPNKVNEFEVNWEEKLSKGQYRIVKPISTTKETSNIAVNFSID